MTDNLILDVRGLKKHFPTYKGFLRRIVGYVRAVDGVDFVVRKNEILGLVGESGCGKTTTARTIARALDPTAGEMLFMADDGVVDIAKLKRDQLYPIRREIQMIFQDPYSSLNPRMTVKQIIAEPLKVHRMATGAKLESRVASLLDMVGLRPEYMERYPHAFSGGQRQRIGIARALSLNPRLVLCDEPVSALDMSVQAQILNLLQELQETLGLSYVFVAHDLSVVEHVTNRVAVMYVGKIVELAPTEALFGKPRHPYTEALLSSVPVPDPELTLEKIMLLGEVADPSNPPTGCHFHPRCRYAEDRCRTDTPSLRVPAGEADTHSVACHLAEKLELNGVAAE